MNNSERFVKPFLDRWFGNKSCLKTVFLLGDLPNPRLEKRISFFKSRGAVEVFYAKRPIIGYKFDKTQDDVIYKLIDVELPTSRDLLKRWSLQRKFSNHAMSLLTNSCPDILFVNTLDGLMVARKYKIHNPRVRIIYEIADLVRAYIAKPKNLIEKIKFLMVKVCEEQNFSCVDLLTITSKKFYDVHFHNLIGKDKCVFIPNAPDTEVFAGYHRKTDGKFTVGFVGGLRYYPQLKMLVDASQVVGCDVIFAGSNDGSKEYLEFEKYAKQFANIKFTGRFNFEKEAAGLYSQLDCVYCVYGLDDPNAKVLLPNKLYESIICKLPILGSKGTYLGELIDEWGVGLTVSDTNVDELVEALKKLRDDNELRQRIERNCEERYCELGL